MEDLPRPWPEYDMPPALALPPDPAMDAANGPSPGAGPASLYGACSIETYRAAGALHAAHRDAGGFLDAVDRFAAPDFWRRDGAVKSWIYDRQPVQHAPGRDMDSVRVFYHAAMAGWVTTGSFTCRWARFGPGRMPA